MKQYIFSTRNHIDGLSRKENEEITLHELKKIITNKVVFMGISKRENYLRSILYYGDFLSLYHLIISDCNNYDIYINNRLLNIYGTYSNGYIDMQVYFLTPQGENVYLAWRNNVILTDKNEIQVIKHILNKRYYKYSGDVINKELFNV